MTPQTKQVLQEAIEILNRIQGKEKTHKWFKELTFVDNKKSIKTKEVKHGSRSSKV